MTEEWQQGRWEETIKKSKWHFDMQKPAEPGLDSYTHVCRFVHDFAPVVEQCKPLAKKSTWETRNHYDPKIAQEGLYSWNAEQRDLIAAGADPNMEEFARAAADDIEVFRKIADWLGLEEPAIKFHNQTTGQMLVEHIDNFAGRKERENSFKETDFDKNPQLIRRFAIMLDDWKLGQVFQLGNANFHQWRAGDCITWEWQDMPHATCNMGWWDRPMLQITGYTTERTWEVLKNSNKNQEINI